MKIRHVAIAGATALAALGGATSASAANGVTQHAPDVYGQYVNTSAGRLPSSTAINNYLMWDTNGYYVTVTTQLRDTGRNDGQLAGLYANLVYTDNTSSGLKLVDETGNEGGFDPPVARRFVPSKRVLGVQLFACRRSAAAGINSCTPSAPLWDNPYT